MRISSPWIFCLPLLALSACSHTTREDCAQNDYYAMGLADGQSGRTHDHLTQTQDLCAKAGAPVPVDQYENGYRTGLNEYCTSDRARGDAQTLSPSPACEQAKVPIYVDAYNDQIEKVRDAREQQLQDAQKREGKARDDMNQIDRQKAQDE